MNERLLEKVEDLIYDLLYLKVAKTFENVSLSYGTVVKLPAITKEEWSAITKAADLQISFGEKEDYFPIEAIYKNAIYDYLINELNIHEVPGEFYSYHTIRDLDGGMTVIIDMDYFRFLADHKPTTFLIMQNENNSDHKRYFVQIMVKHPDRPDREDEGYLVWKELTLEEVQELIQQTSPTPVA